MYEPGITVVTINLSEELLTSWMSLQQKLNDQWKVCGDHTANRKAYFN